MSDNFQKLCHYAQLIRLDRPIGSLLLLWPTLWGLWVAGEGTPKAHHLLIFIAGVFVMRSAGCIINDIADRKIDPHVERTKHRPLASGKLTLKEAVFAFVLLTLTGLFLVMQLNRTAVLFSFGALSFIMAYPFMKRLTSLPQFFLGATFSWSIPMAFAAETGQTTLVCWLLFLANLSWVTAYDTMYGMVDRDDDLKIGVKSTAILFGKYDVLITMAFNVFTLFLLWLCGVLLALNSFYNFGLLLSAGFLVYQYFLIKDRNREKCFRAFLNNTWFGAGVFVSLMMGYLPL